MSRCSFANSTTFSKKGRSTQVVVGLWGNERISSFALGQASLAVSWSRAKKSPPGVRGTERRSPSAMTTEYEWIGYVGFGTSAPSPGWRTASARCARPSLAPIVAIASDSGSNSTRYRSRYHFVMAMRRRVIPREAE